LTAHSFVLVTLSIKDFQSFTAYPELKILLWWGHSTIKPNFEKCHIKGRPTTSDIRWDLQST